jgi:hypothetical protein
MKRLESRIAALERRQQQHGEVKVVLIRGGLHDGDPTYGKVGELRFQRADDKTFPAFHAQTLAAAAAAGERLVVIGGLAGVSSLAVPRFRAVTSTVP